MAALKNAAALTAGVTLPDGVTLAGGVAFPDGVGKTGVTLALGTGTTPLTFTMHEKQISDILAATYYCIQATMFSIPAGTLDTPPSNDKPEIRLPPDKEVALLLLLED